MARPVSALPADLTRLVSGVEAAVLRPVAAVAQARIASTAVTRFMRDAGGEPRRRSATDRGPLRIVTGRAARSLTGGGGSSDAIQETEMIGPAKVRITKGSRAPGIAYNEMRRAKSGASLATLRPALEAEIPAIEAEAAKRLTAWLGSLGQGGTP